MDKQAIRRKVLAKVKGISPIEKKKRSSKVMDELLASEEFRKARVIMFYCSRADEIDTAPIIRAAFDMGKEVVVPVTVPDEKRLIPSRIIDYEALVAGPYGILQPKPDSIREVAVRDIDLVIVPAVAFDKKGNRLGRGVGYYDRFLLSLPKGVPKIGLAFSLQILDHLPTSCHDMPVDKVISY